MGVYIDKIGSLIGVYRLNIPWGLLVAYG